MMGQVAHGCNLSCTSCALYSNHHHTGMLSLATARDWMSAWSKRLRPQQFSLLGGEPALNPALPQFVWLAREMFPDAHAGESEGLHPGERAETEDQVVESEDQFANRWADVVIDVVEQKLARNESG